MFFRCHRHCFVILAVAICAIFTAQLIIIQAEQAGLLCAHGSGGEASTESSSASTDEATTHDCCDFCCYSFLGHLVNFSFVFSFGGQESYVLFDDLLPDSPILAIDYPPQLSLS
jgi:hypothetical protein